MLSAKIVRKGRIDERALKRAVGKWLPIAGYAVEGQAKELAPVDTGNLKASITSRVVRNAAIVGTNVEYAPYMEYGTRFIPEGRPFLRVSLDIYRKRLVEMLRKLYVAEVKKDGVK